MADAFLNLPHGERRKILATIAARLGRPASILEKDVWVCWALEKLWSTSGNMLMAFKGGTSLSKAYGAIDRFSEDIDVTIDYRSLYPGLDPFAEDISRTKLKKAGEKLKKCVRDHVDDVILPKLKNELSASGSGRRVEVSDDREQVRIHYDAAAGDHGTYISDSVLLEFGGRNTTEPSEPHTLAPYLASEVQGLEFPSPCVDVLCAKRTFWEKVTMMHAESQRGHLRRGADRLSRHWYDIYVLSDHEIGRGALADRALLEDVVRHKKAFFHTGSASYGSCLDGRMRLLPDATGRSELANDYAKMLDAGMFAGVVPSFPRIVERIEELQRTINGIG